MTGTTLAGRPVSRLVLIVHGGGAWPDPRHLDLPGVDERSSAVSIGNAADVAVRELVRAGNAPAAVAWHVELRRWLMECDGAGAIRLYSAD